METTVLPVVIWGYCRDPFLHSLLITSRSWTVGLTLLPGSRKTQAQAYESKSPNSKKLMTPYPKNVAPILVTCLLYYGGLVWMAGVTKNLLTPKALAPHPRPEAPKPCTQTLNPLTLQLDSFCAGRGAVLRHADLNCF